jgi:hypothetical protein
MQFIFYLFQLSSDGMYLTDDNNAVILPSEDEARGGVLFDPCKLTHTHHYEVHGRNHGPATTVAATAAATTPAATITRPMDMAARKFSVQK